MYILKEHAKLYWRDILFSIIAVVIMAGSSLWQPRLLQSVMQAIIADDQDKVVTYGIQLIILATIGLIAGVINTILLLKSHKVLQLMFVKRNTNKFNLFRSLILKNSRLVI